MSRRKTRDNFAGLPLDEEHLLAIRERLAGGCLSGREFDDLVEIWVEKGYGNWFLKRKNQGSAFRDQFVARLRDGKDTWEELIQAAVKRAGKDERQYIQKVDK
jgi:hypothetical protein